MIGEIINFATGMIVGLAFGVAITCFLIAAADTRRAAGQADEP